MYLSAWVEVRDPKYILASDSEQANYFLSNYTQGIKTFISVLMNELFRSSEFIAFGVQKLGKAHVNSKQCCFGFVP